MNYIEKLTSLFEKHRNEEQSVPMMNYMKNQFLFLGIKSPQRIELMKIFYKNNPILKEPFNEKFVLGLWEKDEREFQYGALDYIEKFAGKLEKHHLILLETLITRKSWWDTIDSLAPKSVAGIAAKFPEVIIETIDKWASCDEMWLNRSAILFQLKLKDRTDEKLLYSYIRQNAASNEFFINKAIGWSLREYSKTNPDSVENFIKKNRLSKLSVREGSKYLVKSGI